MYLLSYNSFFNLNKDGCSFLWNLQWIGNPEVPIYWCSIAGECHIPQYRTSHPEAHCHPKVNLKSFTKLKGKHIVGISSWQSWRIWASDLIKKRLRQSYFPVNFAKVVISSHRTPWSDRFVCSVTIYFD